MMVFFVTHMRFLMVCLLANLFVQELQCDTFPFRIRWE